MRLRGSDSADLALVLQTRLRKLARLYTFASTAHVNQGHDSPEKARMLFSALQVADDSVALALLDAFTREEQHGQVSF